MGHAPPERALRESSRRPAMFLTHLVLPGCCSGPTNRYHFDGPLPEYDVVCKERLVRPEDPANPSTQLALQIAAQVETGGEATEGPVKISRFEP